MSTKKFTVIDTRTGLKKTFDSEANTVRELKNDFERLSISTEGMTIQEGLTRTELVSDDSYLPHDVPYKGSVTNNLVFRLTMAEKKIKSGSYSRKEVYSKVKELGLQKTIEAKYGKNFTMCKTVDLIKEIELASKKAAPKAEAKAEAEAEPSNKKAPKCSNAVEEAITLLTSKLVDCGVFSKAEGTEITDTIGTSLEVSEDYSYEDINDMFEGM